MQWPMQWLVQWQRLGTKYFSLTPLVRRAPRRPHSRFRAAAPRPSSHFAGQQEYVFDCDRRASEKHLGGLVSIDCDWALVTFCHQFWESIDDSVEGTKCRALRVLLA